MTKEFSEHFLKAVKALIPVIHPGGWPFIAGFAGVTAFLALFSNTMGLIGLALTLWCIWFFRDPERITPTHEGFIISPADGRIVSITESAAPTEINLADDVFTRIAIHLNLFDVHVQRIPCNGQIENVFYHPGLFLHSTHEQAANSNERNTIVLKVKNNKTILVSQIAGFIRRRILCDARPQQNVTAGERYGLIRFGSQVDIYLPKEAKILVGTGQTMVAGETILAEF